MTTTTKDIAALKVSASLEEYRAAGGECDSIENQRIRSKLVQNNVSHCLSCLISDLAKWEEDDEHEDVLELCYPVQDWDSALEEADEDTVDWCDVADALSIDFDKGVDDSAEPEDGEFPEDAAKSNVNALAAVRKAVKDGDNTAQEVCEEAQIDAHECEVYEHWLVDSWFAARLNEQGEKTGSVHGLTVWARTTTGQAIAMDYVTARIAAGMQILAGQRNEWKRRLTP